MSSRTNDLHLRTNGRRGRPSAFRPWLLPLLLVLASCAEDGATRVPADPEPVVGDDRTIEAFASTHVYFGEENRRTIDVEVDFPPAGESFAHIALDFGLRCPDGRCDAWDRVGWISILEAGPGEEPVEIELSRFVTPYGVGATWTVDLTDLRPVLTGRRTVRVFIDTWVGPGHPSGDGWLVDASFVFEGGRPEREVLDVRPVWSPHARLYGNPDVPFRSDVFADVHPEATSVALRSFVTGHGQGNAANCAEFCAQQHWFVLGAERRELQLWRSDCVETAAPGQLGNWTSSRAGWCPGAEVRPWHEEFDVADTGIGTTRVSYDAQDYENTCRPDASPCGDCVFGTSCEYDGGAHTPPIYYLSSALISYR